MYQGQVSLLRAWWSGDVYVSLLPRMCAPTQVCVTHTGPNGNFEACTHESVSTNTQTPVTSDLNLKPEAAWGKVMSWIGTDRLTDWYWTLAAIDDKQRALSPSASSVAFRTDTSTICFILLFASYLVPKRINFPTSAFLHLLDVFMSTPSIFLNSHDSNGSRFCLKSSSYSGPIVYEHKKAAPHWTEFKLHTLT